MLWEVFSTQFIVEVKIPNWILVYLNYSLLSVKEPTRLKLKKSDRSGLNY